MRRVDENYAYDEMEGFEVLKIDPAVTSCKEIWMSVYRGKLCFSQAARDILYGKGWLQLKYNAEKKQLAAIATSLADEGMLKTGEVRRQKRNYAIDCTNTARFIANECRYDAYAVRLYIKGTPARSRPGAIIFDFKTVYSKKPKNRKDEK